MALQFSFAPPPPTSLSSRGVSGVVGQLSDWVLHEMAGLNRAVLAHRRAPEAFASGLSGQLDGLPAPESFTQREAQQMVVLLGLAGASLGRHYQERHENNRSTPERAFDGLRVGAGRTSFRDYFTGLAERTGTGHYHRDSYASLVRWNLPTTQLSWAGRTVASMPGVFERTAVHSYTGTAEEARFFGLLKLSETLELGVNTTLAPLHAGDVDPAGDEAVHLVATAVLFVQALRRLNARFAALPARESLSSGYFLDVFRQYAVHWVAGDIPPSGALDPEAISRDVLLGIEPVGYRAHIARLFPALLDDERARIAAQLDGRPLPALVLARLGLPGEIRLDTPPAGLSMIAARYPILAALALLYHEHARQSGVHLMMTKKFLFNPQRARDQAGLGDPGVVSNRRGTTGMDEPVLERLTRARQQHSFAAFRRVPSADLERACGLDRVRREGSEDLAELIQFAPERPPGPVAIRPRSPETVPTEQVSGAAGRVDGDASAEHGNAGRP